ncbi:MAG: hypothetical protein NC124_20315, partial [Clostridium sp.]|nr:hypothetical protein [Clostridium sp.]
VGTYTFSDLVELFKSKTIPYQIVIETLDITTDTALNTFIYYYELFCTGVESFTFAPQNHIEYNFICEHICPYFMGFNLIDPPRKTSNYSQKYQISKYGLKFYSLLEINGYIK